MFDNENKNCKLTIYVDRPAAMVPKKIRNRPNAPANEANLSDVGHVFLGLTDENGVEKRIGFYAQTFAFGAENVPPQDRIESPLKDAFKKVSGVVLDETHRRYHDAIQYSITPKQYKEAFKYIEEWKERDPKYVLLLNNCVSFSIKTARKIGLRPPPQIILGIPSPHSTSISIQLKDNIDKITSLPLNAIKKLSKFFGGEGDVVHIIPSEFLKKATKKITNIVEQVIHKVVAETTLGMVDSQSHTTVKDEGVKTELSDTLRTKSLKRKPEDKKDGKATEKSKLNNIARIRSNLAR